MTRPPLGTSRWPADDYDRDALPERVLQFGTGMLLRALPCALIDAANRAGRAAGRVVVVQSTAGGLAAAINAQGGLFTLVERGAEGGRAVERTRLVGAISRALVADGEWGAVRDVAASPALRAIVSNVTEAGFRPGQGFGFPEKLEDLLHARFERAPDAPPLLVIPTELVDDNGPRLREMIDALAARRADADAFRAWRADRVRFCSSLVDRITTGMPAADVRDEIEGRLGYADALLTVAEPYALWAVEGDPAELRDALPIDDGERAVFAPDIRTYRERKIRLLNGAHTALAPLARLAGVRTVREAMAHDALGPLARRLLFDEIAPSTDLPEGEAASFAASVLDRFGNPWLDHEWSVIATNQTPKMRLRVAPSVAGYAMKRGAVAPGLALAVAAYLRHARCADGAAGEGEGAWRGAAYRLVDAELGAVARHWRAAEGAVDVAAPPSAESLRRVAESAVADDALWGRRLGAIPGLADAVAERLAAIERDGPAAAGA